MDEPWECSDGRGSPQGGRRYPGLQIMGSGLLAEMKAKQERRAHKVRWCEVKLGTGGRCNYVPKVSSIKYRISCTSNICVGS